MNEVKRVFALVLAAGVLTVAPAGPAQAAWNTSSSSSLNARADIMEETESENRGRISMTVGETRDLSESIRWKGYDEDEEDITKRQVVWQLYSVRWSSSSEAVSVDENGVATANRAGTARITATGTDNTGQRRVQTITIGVQSAASTTASASASHSLEVPEGRWVGLAALIDPDGSKSVSWSSSNATIASVDADGLLDAVSIGRATVTASWTDADGAQRSEEIALRVVSGLVENRSRAMTVTLSAGDALDVAAFYYPTYGSASPRGISIASSNSAVADCSAMVLTAKAAGSCTLTIYEQSGYEQTAVQRITVRVAG